MSPKCRRGGQAVCLAAHVYAVLIIGLAGAGRSLALSSGSIVMAWRCGEAVAIANARMSPYRRAGMPSFIFWREHAMSVFHLSRLIVCAGARWRSAPMA